MVIENTFSIGKAAKFLGVTVKTLQRWDRERKLIPMARSQSNRRLYTEQQLREFYRRRDEPAIPKRLIAYCRVSSQAQKPDLVKQRRVLEEFIVVSGLANVEFIEEIGGGLNFKRKKFLLLMDAIGNREVATLMLAHRDRLARFGFEWFEHFARSNDCEILILNQEGLSPEQEMMQDLMTIVHCFSSRLHGLRNYKKKLHETLRMDVEHER